MHGVANFQVAGVVVQDPEVTTLNNGVTRAKVLVAVDKFTFVQGETRQSTTWFRFVYYRDQAKKAIERMRKGTRVYVSGEIEQYTMRIGDQDVNFHRFVPDMTRMLLSVREHDALRSGWAASNRSQAPADEEPPQAPPGPGAGQGQAPKTEQQPAQSGSVESETPAADPGEPEAGADAEDEGLPF